MKKIVFGAIGCLLFAIGNGQAKDARQQKKDEKKEKIQELIIQEEQGALIFQKQSVFGIKLNTDGYGAFYEMGRLKTSRKTNLYSLEIGERKHPKEDKVPGGDQNNFGSGYIYGKINNFYYAKLGFAQQQIIGNKGNKNGVAVAAIYGGGISAGLLKPYYIKFADQNNEVKDIKYNNNDSLFLDNPASVLGSSGFTKGFGEIKFTPGIYAKTALRFDYGRFNELVSAIEVGFNVEFYTKKMRQLLLVKDKQLFFNAYVAIEFGRRK